jgi:hypothetical protein
LRYIPSGTFRPKQQARLICSRTLAQGQEGARPAQLANIEISPSGLGLHFPQLDADLYLPALLQGFLDSRQWMAQAMGKVGGQSANAREGPCSPCQRAFGWTAT